MADLTKRTEAIFGRRHALVVARAIAKLPDSFSKDQLVGQVGLGVSPKTQSLISREIAALIKAGLIRRVAWGWYSRTEDAYWDFASGLYDSWSKRPGRAKRRTESSLRLKALDTPERSKKSS
jgi:hypothetical protein